MHFVDGVEQVGARTVRRLAGAGAEVLNGQALVGGIVEVEVAEGCVGLGGEFVGLGDADFAGLFPLGDAVEFDGDLFGQVLLGEAGAFAGPAEDVGLEGDLEAAGGHGVGCGWIGLRLFGSMWTVYLSVGGLAWAMAVCTKVFLIHVMDRIRCADLRGRNNWKRVYHLS